MNGSTGGSPVGLLTVTLAVESLVPRVVPSASTTVARALSVPTAGLLAPFASRSLRSVIR